MLQSKKIRKTKVVSSLPRDLQLEADVCVIYSASELDVVDAIDIPDTKGK